MKRKLEYRVITARSLNDLEDRINNGYIPLGWEPVGGISCTDKGFFQAVVFTKRQLHGAIRRKHEEN